MASQFLVQILHLDAILQGHLDFSRIILLISNCDSKCWFWKPNLVESSRWHVILLKDSRRGGVMEPDAVDDWDILYENQMSGRQERSREPSNSATFPFPAFITGGVLRQDAQACQTAASPLLLFSRANWVTESPLLRQHACLQTSEPP